MSSRAVLPSDGRTTVESPFATCTVVCGDSREELKAFEGRAALIVTPPPYAAARHGQYGSVHPDVFAECFMTFHGPFRKRRRRRAAS